MLDVQIDYKKNKKKVNIFHRSLKTYTRTLHVKKT